MAASHGSSQKKPKRAHTSLFIEQKVEILIRLERRATSYCQKNMVLVSLPFQTSRKKDLNLEIIKGR
jgi:hypothetical protein